MTRALSLLAVLTLAACEYDGRGLEPSPEPDDTIEVDAGAGGGGDVDAGDDGDDDDVEDPPVAPTGVSFKDDVFPIFTSRGCVDCHTSAGSQETTGDLRLDGGSGAARRALVEDDGEPPRIDLDEPTRSLVLTMPSFEVPADRHPVVIFATPLDADYLTILGWIQEGAHDN